MEALISPIQHLGRRSSSQVHRSVDDVKGFGEFFARALYAFYQLHTQSNPYFS